MYFIVGPSGSSTAEQNSESNQSSRSSEKPSSFSINANGALVRSLNKNLNEVVRTPGSSNNSIILLRGTRISDNGHILIKDENRTTTVIKTIDESEDMGQILVQQNDLSEGVLLQSVKRLGGNGGPVLLYTSGSDTVNGNGHIFIQTTASGDEFRGVCDAAGQRPVLLQAVEAVTKEEPPVATPLGSDGEPIKLPENLESLPRADHFPTQRHRWNTNEEIAAILISFDRHTEWQSKEVKIRPKSGSMLLYSRKKVRYRRDGYCWKKRKDGKTTREDHMKLKVQGTECIYGCYVHSAILPTFHRRCYWLLQNPDIVLVHYLNVPYPDDNKLAVITPSLALWADKKEWTKDELVSQLKPMFFSEDEPDLNNELEISTAETVEAIVSQLMEKQRQARQAALVKQLECGCPDSTCADGKTCSHPMRRITAAKSELASSPLPSSSSNSRSSNADNNNQVSSTTGSGGMLLSSSPSPRVYSRDSRNHHGQSGSSSVSANTPPLVLSLSQIQGSGGLLILNSNASTSTNSSTHQSLVSPVSVTSFVCSTNTRSQRHNDRSHKSGTIVLKQEAMDTNSSSCCQQQSESGRTIKMDVSNRNSSRNIFVGSPFSVGNKSHDMNNQQQNDMMSIPSAPSTPSKQMDTSNEEVVDFKHQNFCEETVVLLGTDSSGSLISKSDGSSVINGGFFNETLDLSQEDIQRTLSANMPLCSSELEQHDSVVNDRNSVIANKQAQASTDMVQDDVIVSEVNPMDFINSCDVVVSPTHVVDDDVFVNLDAFDMLGEFPELEVLEGGHGNSLLDVTPSVGSRNEKSSATIHVSHEHMEGTAKISDYSPEWAYPEGGVKVLVTGPWHSSAPYTVLFDTFPVPTTLVQSGVLRCFCPAHEAGLATLQVACDGYVISNSVIFEYKLPPREERTPAPEPKVERSNDNLLKFTLLQRLEAMDDRLQIKQEPADGPDCVEDSALFQQSNFEDRLVTYCQAMTSRLWHAGEELSVAWFASHRGMTLLHLAASLGYSKLVCAMLHWRAENSSLLLETEVDALSQDEDGFTPLMWACARGHTETAVMLYRWNHTALNIRNAIHQTALECARANNHSELAREVEKLDNRREKANMLLHSSSTSSTESVTLSPVGISPASSIVSLSSVASTSKSHDGVFLRPGAVTRLYSCRSESQKYKSLNLDFESTIPSTSSSELNITKISSVATQSPQSSEMTIISRPGSQPYQRLVKRPSVDSGIYMTSGHSSDSLPSLRNKITKGSGREIPKLSRFDRSMSLPLNSPQSNLDNSFDSGTADITPSRKMDFALCEVGTGPRSNSPLIDVEALSDDEESDHRQSTVGEQDVRVLTLAEQIIAAMPDRIKNESEEMLLDANSPPGPLDSLQSSDTLSDVFMEPLLDHSSSSYEPVEFNFEFSDHNYRYYDVGTPCSSLSPASSSCLQSPCSFTLDSPSPPPTTADFCEFFQASSSLFEKDFSNLTLSDQEQRELYEAAKIIQKAYRSYKGRQKLEEQDKERAAAILIQNYYRRYKQYAYFKQMTHAAMVIQSGFRSYCEHKRFKKSQEAAVCIQNYYRNYKEQGGRGSREGTPAAGLKRTYSQRRQHQAARKIQQFMRQSKNKLQRERAEKEKQSVRSPDVPQRSLCQGVNSTSIDPNNSDNICDMRFPDISRKGEI